MRAGYVKHFTEITFKVNSKLLQLLQDDWLNNRVASILIICTEMAELCVKWVRFLSSCMVTIK